MISETRKYTTDLLKNLEVEESIFNHASKRFKNIENRVIEENDPEEALFESLYRQTLLKFLYNKNTSMDLKDIVSSNRSELAPEKWSEIVKNRSEDNKKLRKKGLHQCHKCKSMYTEHTESQRASADESMCVAVSCLDCGYHFKYS